MIVVTIIKNEKNKLIMTRLYIGSYCISVLDVKTDVDKISMIIDDKYTS